MAKIALVKSCVHPSSRLRHRGAGVTVERGGGQTHRQAGRQAGRQAETETETETVLRAS